MGLRYVIITYVLEVLELTISTFLLFAILKSNTFSCSTCKASKEEAQPEKSNKEVKIKKIYFIKTPINDSHKRILNFFA